jgi:hypothetical protein
LSTSNPLPTASSADFVSSKCCANQEMILLTGKSAGPLLVRSGQTYYLAVYATGHDMQYSITATLSQRRVLYPGNSLTLRASNGFYPAGTLHLYDWSFPQDVSTTSYHYFSLALTFDGNSTARGAIQTTDVLASYDTDNDPLIGSGSNSINTPIPSVKYSGGAFIQFTESCSVRINKTCIYHAAVYLESAVDSYTLTLSSVTTISNAPIGVTPVLAAVPTLATASAGSISYFSFSIPYYGCRVSIDIVNLNASSLVGMAVNSFSGTSKYADTSVYNNQWISPPAPVGTTLTWDWTDGRYDANSPPLQCLLTQILRFNSM